MPEMLHLSFEGLFVFPEARLIAEMVKYGLGGLFRN